MRIPCTSCGNMMLSINKAATLYKCPECGNTKEITPMNSITVPRNRTQEQQRIEAEKAARRKQAAEEREAKGIVSLTIDSRFTPEKYKALRAQGMSNEAIADEMRLTISQLYKKRKEHGLIFHPGAPKKKYVFDTDLYRELRYKKAYELDKIARTMHMTLNQLYAARREYGFDKDRKKWEVKP